jgi:hypothetical protein
MEHEENAGEETGRPVVAMNKVEAVVAAILLVIGIVVIVESRRLGAGWTSDGPGSGYFPFLIGMLVVIASSGMLFESLLGKKKNTDAFVDTVQLKRVLSVLVPALFYVLAVAFLGLYVASAVYIALFMVILGKYSWAKSAFIALAVNVLFFFMFEVWFKVPLFKGSLDPLHFLGY